MATIGLGIIGAGVMGERLLRAARDHARDTVRIAGVWDPSSAAMERIGGIAPDAPRLGSAKAVIEASDCVYVASPPATHLAHGRAALASGKALFCEKPLAVDVADARDFVENATGLRARAGVNFPFASSFAVERLRNWIEDGAVGHPQSLAIEVGFAAWPRPWQRDAASWLDGRAEGGFTREVVSHFLFLARRLLGRLILQSAEVRFAEEASERAMRASLTAGGVPATLEGLVGATDRDDQNSWTVTGDAGAVRLRDWSVAERRLPDGSWQADPEAMPNERARPLVLKRQLAAVAAMTSGERHHLATLDEALSVQEIVEAILRGRNAVD